MLVMDGTTNPIEEQLPMDVQNFLNVFTPNVREWLRQQLLVLLGFPQRIDAFRTRLDAVEGNVEHMLDTGHGTNGAPHGQTIEPIPLATIVERLERIEHALAKSIADRVTELRPPAAHSTPPAHDSSPQIPMAPTVASRPIPAAMADGIRLELLRTQRGGSPKFSAVQQRLMKTHGLTKNQINAIWARCQGKFRPDFVGRIMRNSPNEHRVELRDELARLFNVPAEEILSWYRTRVGNDCATAHRPTATRRVVRKRNSPII